MPNPSARSPCAPLLAAALCAAGLTQLILSASAGPVAATPLEPNKPIERELRPGETHAYEVLVPPDRIVSGTVDQRGIDVMVRLIDPSGKTIATIDSPNGPQGPEPWTLESKPAGTWRLEVVPFDSTKKPGRYETRIDETTTAYEHAERKAKQRYRSPRMVELWKEHRAQGAGAIERFAKQMAGRAPLVEPIEGDSRGDVLLTFLWRGGPDTHYVELIRGPLGPPAEHPMRRFEGSDLWYVTVAAPKDLRITYSFRIGEPRDAGMTRTQAVATFGRTAQDPWNPRQFFGRSLIELPAAPAQPWAERKDGVPQGRMVEATIKSEILGEDRNVGVYLPAKFEPAAGPYPYVVVFDGEPYGLFPGVPIPTPTILDNLIAQGKVPPMLGVLVASGTTRERDLAMSAPFCDFLAKELVPWLRKEYRASEAPAEATLAGSSLGGLTAAYCAFHHSNVFGNVLSQSGSFQFSPGALQTEVPYSIEPGALIREVIGAPMRPLRFWMEVGLFEGTTASNRHMRDVLLLKGYDVSYHEYSGGHDDASWRGSLADGLIALAARPVKP